MYIYRYIYIFKNLNKNDSCFRDYNSDSSISISKTCMRVRYTSLNPHPKVTALVYLTRSLSFR